MFKSLLRIFRKSKSKRNTPWRGWKPGQAAKAFERAFVKRERRPAGQVDDRQTRTILWTVPSGQCRILQVAYV